MNILLVKYGEIALRGKNRHLFENRLINSIQKKINKIGSYRVSKEQGRILVKPLDSMNYDGVIPEVVTTLGVTAACPAVLLNDMDMESLKSAAADYMRKFYPEGGRSFKVETKRGDKRYPLKSQEISAAIGGHILDNMGGFKVDVRNPEITLYVELRNNAYIYSKIIRGCGGLPIGSTGKGLVLLSGGIDSPAAAYMMAKRGVETEAVYFHSAPFTSERAKLKVIDLAKRLSVFTGAFKLHIVSFTDIQLLLKEKCQSQKLTLLLKRAMLRISQKIAEEIQADVLITGDCIGQVASQTIRSINACSSATSLPIIRPLAGMDKQEIIDLAKRIETFEISIRPYEDCCTLFVDEHPETSPKTSAIESVEARLMFELEPMIAEAVSTREIMEI